MATSANTEQLKAIEHNGGVLLSAGAGSGKTFVLTEHLLYLTDNWIREYKENPIVEFNPWIKERYSKVVMMTFTNKAAGEILIRIKNKFIDRAQKESDELWASALEELDALTISTIHGFCLKLIQMGLLPRVPSQIEIITEVEFDIIIRNICNKWFEKQIRDESPIASFLLSMREEIIESVKKIISDPILRKRWLETKYDLEESNLDGVIKEIFTLNGFDQIITKQDETYALLDNTGKKWEQELLDFKTQIPKDLNEQSFIEFCSYFEEKNFKIAVSPRGKAVPLEVISYYKSLKELKDYCKKHHEDFFAFKDSGRIAAAWYECLFELINYTSVEYEKEGVLTFGDLEYLAYTNLSIDGVADTVGRQFSYIIVDEFQDTSSMQFEIISLILNKDLGKLFCVGDLKQAIYGFRGGELEVFQSVEKLINKNLLLSNNYRSKENIINFNNDFFSYIFKTGDGYTGTDPFTTLVVPQNSPLDDTDKGKVEKVCVDISFVEVDQKLSNSDLNYLEALAIAEKIKQISSDQNISVLYKKLKPSQILVKLLISEGIGFTSQIKIPYLEDPVIGIFHDILNYKLNVSDLRGDLFLLGLRSYLRLLGIKDSNPLILKKFEENESLFGMYNAFLMLITDLGLSISQYSNNLIYLKKIIKACIQDYEKIYRKLEQSSQNSYSTEFQYGDSASRVTLMSAHASKGLEFENVFLAGIYTNDRGINKTNFLGKIPLSFKWKEDIKSKTSYKTPYYIIESEREKYKDFSEAKRLFYVAATRAQESLFWVDINLENHKAQVGKNTWIKAIKVFEENQVDTIITSSEIDIKNKFSNSFLSSIEYAKPLFHERSVGIDHCEKKSELMFLTEMSVTRLAQITSCPFCFYLEQIIKLETEKGESKFIDEDEVLTSSSFVSSAKRGSEIHDKISRVILGNFDSSLIEGKYEEEVQWTVDKLQRDCGQFTYISEKQIKFPVFNFMISGIPDLIIKADDNSTVEIWDYKTGAIKENESYWFQLMCYAYAYYQLNDYELPIKIVLCYVDERQNLERNTTITDVENYLWNYWKKIQHPGRDHITGCNNQVIG